MNSQEIAEKFVRFFCKGDLEGLGSVIAENFRLQGPLMQTESRTEYLGALSDNLVPDPQAKILASFGNANCAAVFYTYRGNTMGQLFSCSDGRVDETTLVFDTKNVV